jgi:Na+/H+-dicarboxylate symporter
VILALLFGFGFRRVKREQLANGERSYEPVEQAIQSLLRVVEIILGWTLVLVPVAVFGVVAKTVAEYGYAPMRACSRTSPRASAASRCTRCSCTTRGSSPTRACRSSGFGRPRASRWSPRWDELESRDAPVTLKALDSLGVSRASSALGACVGTNLNNDGIVLYEGMAVLFVAQASGLRPLAGQQMAAALTALVAAMGVAGVPEAGFVSLALVLNTVQLPIELLPLLLTVDWVIARGRSVVNVLSDMILSIAIEGPQSTSRR